tara:strand:- start:7093 stop:7665 length:573 start_codon:yes stop_codon:yes gene_type:complete
MNKKNTQTLEEQRIAFSKKRFLAMPLAGSIVWTVIGLIGATMSPVWQVWSVWIGCGSIVYLGMALAPILGEDFFNKQTPNNAFNHLFMVGLVMALLVFSLALPFAMQDYSSIPLTVGILSGLMWMPFSWAIQHWAGYFHAISRTALVLSVWIIFPEHRFVAIPVVIVVIYIITMLALERRYKAVNCLHEK